jgi:hypothetical protein
LAQDRSVDVEGSFIIFPQVVRAIARRDGTTTVKI